MTMVTVILAMFFIIALCWRGSHLLRWFETRILSWVLVSFFLFFKEDFSSFQTSLDGLKGLSILPNVLMTSFWYMYPSTLLMNWHKVPTVDPRANSVIKGSSVLISLIRAKSIVSSLNPRLSASLDQISSQNLQETRSFLALGRTKR
jgi:hypothetical protein